jgi:hypothetical protein
MTVCNANKLFSTFLCEQTGGYKSLKGRRRRPCHVSGIPLQKGFFPFCKGKKPGGYLFSLLLGLPTL